MDDRQSLYEEFISEVVKGGNQEAYFDEADLVEIYDYSSDMDNYIAKMEVLLYGARHYPDSQALATRRAWFYSSFGEMDAAAELNSRVSNGGVLNELLQLRSIGGVGRDVIAEKLDELVDHATDFADEELIQLADYCAEMDMFDWLEKNFEKVKAKCSYPQTFIYEYANGCEDHGLNKRAIALFEELTMLDPFAVDFWERLAIVQFKEERYDASLQSAEYALAIDPDATEALRAKAMSLYALKREPWKSEQIFRRLVAMPNAQESDLGALVGMLIDADKEAAATKAIVDYLEQHGVSRLPVGMLLTLAPELSDKYVIAFDEEQRALGTTLIDWAKEEYRMQRLTLAGRLVLYELHLHPRPMPPGNTIFAMEALYACGVYDQVIKLAQTLLEEPRQVLWHSPLALFLYMSSLDHAGDREQAKAVAREVRALGSPMAIKIPDDGLISPGITPAENKLLTWGINHYIDALLEGRNLE